MGRDKFENEDLIRYGWPEDVWFHVEHLSSAHVYLRCPADTDWETLPNELVQNLCQLVKHNSIEGSKRDQVDVVYTPWSNLKKTGNMEIGQVSFKNEKFVKHVKRVSKEKDIVKQLEKTREEKEVDLKGLREARDRAEVEKLRKLKKEQIAKEKAERQRHEEERALKNYDSLFAEAKQSNLKGDGTIESCREIEEDFM